MKRKNLFLTLISSILVTIAIVTVTVCSVIPKKNNNNNNESDAPTTDIVDTQLPTKEPEADDVNTPVEPEHTHEWSIDWSSDATYHWHICSGCEEISDKAEHEWDGGEITTVATEDTEGEMTYTCNVCSATKTEVIAALGHSHNKSGDWSKDGTCHWHVCAGCDEKLDVANHEWNDGEITIAATETAKGVKTYTCTVCEATKTEEIPALGHTHNWSSSWSKNDTYHWHACAGCSDVLDKAEHEWNKGEITTAATATEKGVKTFTCAICEATKTEEVPALSAHYDYLNDNERDGSEEKPYIIYSAENFANMIRMNGEGCYFEIVSDIDFAGKNVPAIFTGSRSFKGVIEGNGYALKNISINVNADNLSKYTYTKNGYKYVRVSLIGTIGSGSKISNLKIENLNVTLADEVYDIVTAEDSRYAEVSVAGLATYAFGTTIENVDFEATVNGFSIKTQADESGTVYGYNAMGGMFAVTQNVVVSNSNIKAIINVNQGSRTCVGGLSAYLFNNEIKDTNVDVVVNTTATRYLKIAGLAAYAKTINVENANVSLKLTEVDSEYVSEYTEDNTDSRYVTEAAGLVYLVRADSYDKQKANFTNVKVTSDIDFDCIYAGAIMDVASTAWYKNAGDENNAYIVELTDVVVDIDANVLAIHAIARQLKVATVSYTSTDAEGYFNIRIVGGAKLSSYLFYNSYANYKLTVKAISLISATDTYEDKYYDGTEMVAYKAEAYYEGKKLCVEITKTIEDAIRSNSRTKVEKSLINSMADTYEGTPLMKSYKIITIEG